MNIFTNFITLVFFFLFYFSFETIVNSFLFICPTYTPSCTSLLDYLQVVLIPGAFYLLVHEMIGIAGMLANITECMAR